MFAKFFIFVWLKLEPVNSFVKHKISTDEIAWNNLIELGWETFRHNDNYTKDRQIHQKKKFKNQKIKHCLPSVGVK